MSYNPPSKDNWHYTGWFSESYKEYYDKGYNEAKEGKEYKEPFKDSGHERDTTYGDELNYWYYKGYYNYEKEDTRNT